MAAKVIVREGTHVFFFKRGDVTNLIEILVTCL
jgi:hypothetical protein